jgi:hypothetical protein
MTSEAPGADHSRPQIVLHIGTMKSGTSYLQAVLRRNSSKLGDQGIRVLQGMVAGVVDVLDRRNVSKKPNTDGAWDRVLEQVNSWEGPLVVGSQEFLSGATPDEAKTVVATFVERPLRVVVTCRDLLRVVPSHWQTVVKNGGTVAFSDYVQLLLADDDSGDEHRYATGFWRHHDVREIVETWASVIGLENVVVVTVPPAGAPRDLLWKRFAEAAGLPSLAYNLGTNAKSNVSLTYAETEMLREVNLGVRKSLNQLEYRLIVNKYFANKVLRQPPDTDRPADTPTFGRSSHDRIRARAEAMAQAVEATGVHIVGDLDELRVPPYAGADDAEDSAGPRDPVPESVVYALTKVVTRLARAEREVKRLKRGSKSWGRKSKAGRPDLEPLDDEDFDE